MSFGARTIRLAAAPVLLTVGSRWVARCWRTVVAVRVLRAVETGSVVNSGSATPAGGTNHKQLRERRPASRQEGISHEEDNA
ncbi:hypothetical protein ACFYU5_25505 [Nocardia aobensis]|uniref:Secreted protein n=1 Tax=Nocardia aobensis TaxID=257277 RepID=A0ABW6P9D4_9NOCA